MRGMTVVVAVAVALLAAAAVQADTLVYTDGRKLAGRVEDVTILTDGVPGIYARKAILSIAMGTEGTVTVSLDSGPQRSGTLSAVHFRTADGVLTVRGSAVAAVAIRDDKAAKATAGTSEGPGPKSTGPTDADKEAAAERKKLRDANLSLRNMAWDKAEDIRKDEVNALKAERMDDCRKVAQEIRRAEQAIERKERERREAERRWQEAERRWRNAVAEGRSRGHRPRKPTLNDGMENDRRDLDKAKDKKAELQREIAAAIRKIDDREDLRKRRVEATYARQKLALEAGEPLAIDQMIARYKAALGTDDKPQKKSADSKRKDDSARKGG